jgi:hypothetical protein
LSTDVRLSFFQQGKFGTKAAIEISPMMHKVATLAALGFLVFGCSRSGTVQRKQQDYQAVQEGSASGVTSTINAPGETTAPMTNTNVDTTTNLTLPTNPAPLGTDTAGGSMASGMPASNPAATPGMTPAPRPRPSTRTTNAPVVTDTIGSTTPAMPKERAAPQPREPRPPTDTATTDTTATPPTTDTTMTDSSTTSTPQKKKDSDQPPPPPPPTDTRG